MVDKESNKPVKTFRAGQIKASVWKNVKTNKAGENFDAYSISIVKTYKEKDSDNWKETNSFQPDEIAKLELVARKAYEFIVLKE